MDELTQELEQKSSSKKRKVESDEKPMALGLEVLHDLENPQISINEKEEKNLKPS